MEKPPGARKVPSAAREQASASPTGGAESENEERQPHESPKLFGRWSSRCFVCGVPKDGYNTNVLLHDTCQPRYQTHQFFYNSPDLKSCFVSFLPEIAGLTDFIGVDSPEAHPLNKSDGFKDLLLGRATDAVTPNETQGRFSLPSTSNPRLTVGQPVLRLASKKLAAFSGLSDVHILDLSPYIWSGTHKDLKSWAVLAVAIKQHIFHLAVWTAGNAGISLAKIVHRWNATQPAASHRNVYCLFDASAPEDLSQVIVTLQALHCKVAPIATGTGAVLLREQIRNIVGSMVETTEPEAPNELADYWHVTDGWDGVGVLMYNLLALQCLLRLRSQLPSDPGRTYLIVPVGTGSLLFGFYKALATFIEKTRLHVKLVAALPFGDNMLDPFFPAYPSATAPSRPRMERRPPRADKLTGFYSPLSPGLWKLTLNRDFDDPRAVEFIQVDLAEQVEAGARLFAGATGHPIAAEPSALISFGALKELGRRIKANGCEPKHCTAIVVNTGFGVMGRAEEAFYTKSILALG